MCRLLGYTADARRGLRRIGSKPGNAKRKAAKLISSEATHDSAAARIGSPAHRLRMAKNAGTNAMINNAVAA